MIRFSQRSEWPREPNPLSAARAKLSNGPAFIYNLTKSNPTACGLAFPQRILSSAFNRAQNSLYAPCPQGASQVREWAAQYYRQKGGVLDKDDIFLTAGTSEAYSYIFRLLANPGDNILFPAPGYPLFPFLCDLNDLRLKTYKLDKGRNWKIDIGSLEAGIDERTKAVVLVNPNNPTGSYIDEEDGLKVCAICRERNLAIISDEVFFDYRLFRKEEAPTFAANQKTLTFTLGGVSKMLALPQMKLAWIGLSGPGQDLNEAKQRLEIISDTYLSVNTPGQNAFLSWAGYKDKIQARIISRIKKNYAYARDKIEKSKAGRLAEPEGGWYALWQVADNLPESDVLSQTALEKEHIFIHPGYFFDFSPRDNFLVLSLLIKPKIFNPAINRLTTHFHSY